MDTPNTGIAIESRRFVSRPGFVVSLCRPNRRDVRLYPREHDVKIFDQEQTPGHLEAGGDNEKQRYQWGWRSWSVITGAQNTAPGIPNTNAMHYHLHPLT